MAFEKDAYLDIQNEAGSFRINREVATLYTFIGEHAMYNHIFILMGPPEGADHRVPGAFIFQHNEGFAGILDFMKEHQLPMHLNGNEPQPCDIEAFDACIARAAEGLEIPGEWT